ncbi:LysR family transcriptional regulator [Rhizobium sp. R693]|uniref:LysR family transcriptional regulator n=1 Tax=Rhizobium sp. R693 TaxID=1764276 RepID=UPI000B5324CB|nr:LysR family transcriptional regulator [Rhizobium sp. R693]OWV98829.1 LysR family transcriptional regulator [Rhizobium sp. R693]
MTNLGDLEIFAKVAATGSMSVAGRALGYSPAVVSKRIMRLESRLGTRLLQRTTRKVSMTEAGLGFYQRILSVLEGLQEAEGFISGQVDLAQGTLKVSAPTSFGRLHIAPHMAAFLNRYPSISLNLILTDEFSDLVGEGFDMAVRIGELTDSTLVAKRLAAVRRILCASPKYIANNGEPAAFEDLDGHCCLPTHNGEPWRMASDSGKAMHRPSASLATNSSEVVRAAVLSGIGIALRSTWEVGADIRSGQLVQVLPEYEGSGDISIAAVYPSRQFLPVKVRIFIDYLAEIFGEAPYWENG